MQSVKPSAGTRGAPDALRKRLHEMERLIEQDRRVFEEWKRNNPPGASNFPVPREKKPEKR